MAMTTVRDVMTTSVISVAPETPLKEVARLLIEHGISGLPVVDDAGRVVGVISEADLLVKEQGPDAIRPRPLERLLGETAEHRAQRAKLEAVTAGGAMTAPAKTIRPDATIADAAAAMTAGRINRLPVVDDERLAGIVTRADLVRAYVRSDEQLARDIREDVLLHALCLDPAQFEVEVRDGVVRIGGRVDRRSSAEIIERMISMVPGVVDVRPEIAWETDDRALHPPSRDPVFPFGIR